MRKKSNTIGSQATDQEPSADDEIIDAAWWQKHHGKRLDQVTVVDRAPWLNDWKNRLWYQALEEIDNHSDASPVPHLENGSDSARREYFRNEARAKERLLWLFRLGNDISPSIQKHLADLLERHQLVKLPRRGRPLVPSYAKSEKEELLWEAREMVRAEAQRGIKLNVAIEETILGLAGVEKCPKRGVRRRMVIAEAEREIGLTRGVLRNHVLGKRGAERRRANRQKK